jgi:uncharacterized protein
MKWKPLPSQGSTAVLLPSISPRCGLPTAISLANAHSEGEASMDKVVHFEIPFDNKKRAMNFYTEVFGWKLTDLPEMKYVIAETVATNEQHMPQESGAINGGLFERPRDAPSPTLYVDVTSIDEAIRKAEAHGGRLVTPKTPIPGMGSYARVSDSEGNVIGVFQTA